jgi:hypothetical protein
MTTVKRQGFTNSLAKISETAASESDDRLARMLGRAKIENDRHPINAEIIQLLTWS